MDGEGAITDATVRFAEWAIRLAWEGCGLDGGDIQDEAARLGILKQVTYDPEVHGEQDADPGDPWYVFAPEFTAALDALEKERLHGACSNNLH